MEDVLGWSYSIQNQCDNSLGFSVPISEREKETTAQNVVHTFSCSILCDLELEGASHGIALLLAGQVLWVNLLPILLWFVEGGQIAVMSIVRSCNSTRILIP